MKKVFLAGAIAAAFVAMPASAQWYIGGGVGSSSIRGVDGTVAPFTLTGGDSSKASVKIYGGYQITPNWGVEAQYSDLGNRDLTVRNAVGAVTETGSLKASQYSIAGTGTLPLSSNFSLFGKLGISSNHGKVGSIGNSGTKTSPMIGVGVAYNFTPQLAVRFEYEDFGKFNDRNPVSGTAIRADNYGISLKYAF